MDPTRGDSRYNINYSMSSIGLSLAEQVDMYGNPTAVSSLGSRPPSGGLIQSISGSGGGASGLGLSPRGLMPNTSQCQSLVTSNSSGSSSSQRGLKRAGSDCYEDQQHRGSGGNMSHSLAGLESCSMTGGNNQQQQQQQQSGGNVPDVVDESYHLQHKKSPPANGKKTKGRVKIKMEYIDNKLRRYTTFSKRKTGIMKKAYELSTLTGTQVMLLVASETGHVYTFATRKLQPMITSEAGKQLIQTCLNSPDPPNVGSGDQRMSATGFEETELSYNIADDDSKADRSPFSSGNESEESSDLESTPAHNLKTASTSPFVQQEAFKIPQGLRMTSTTASTGFNKTTTEVQQEKGSGSRNTGPSLDRSYPLSSVADLSQEAILQMIKSGQLQLQTEEGRRAQYLSIPLQDRFQISGNDAGRTTTFNPKKSTVTATDINGENLSVDHRRKHVKSNLTSVDIKQEEL